MIKALSILLFLIIGFAATADNGSLEKVQATIETRYWQQGTSMRMEANLYYHTDGRMLTHITEPIEQFIRTNHLGEATIYQPESGRIDSDQQDIYSTQTNHFFIFFQDRTEDMGMDDMGYSRGETEFEDDIRKTIWYAPDYLSGQIDYAKLVHQEFRPIYMAIYDLDGEITQKTYFHNYIDVLEYEFPQSITVIEFDSPADSTVNQTRFFDIRTNQDTDSEMFDFEFPEGG